MQPLKTAHTALEEPLNSRILYSNSDINSHFLNGSPDCQRHQIKRVPRRMYVNARRLRGPSQVAHQSWRSSFCRELSGQVLNFLPIHSAQKLR